VEGPYRRRTLHRGPRPARHPKTLRSARPTSIGLLRLTLRDLQLLKAARPTQPVKEETSSAQEENAVGFIPSTEVGQELQPANAVGAEPLAALHSE
jgi:hypothetical protein